MLISYCILFLPNIPLPYIVASTESIVTLVAAHQRSTTVIRSLLPRPRHIVAQTDPPAMGICTTTNDDAVVPVPYLPLIIC